MNKTLIPLFSFFFIFIFICSTANAYTMFSYNPKFLLDSTGIVIVNEPQNVSYYWNETCGSFNGCLIIDNNYTYTEAIKIFPSQQWQPTFPQQWNIKSDFIDYSNLNGNLGGVTLPANQEAILFIRYKTNNSFSNIPYIYIENNLGNLLLQQNLTAYTTVNIWHNITVFLNASSSQRIIYPYIQFLYDTGGNTAELQIDQFKVYTLDTDENHLWTDNGTNEMIYFCGSDAISPTDLTYVASSYSLIFYNFDINSAWLQCKISDDPSNPIYSGAFKTDDLTRARRYLSKERGIQYITCTNYGQGKDVEYSLMQMRDFYFGWSPFQCTSNWIIRDFYLIEGNSLTTIKVSKLTNWTDSAYNLIISYNGIPNVYGNLSSTSVTGLFNLLSNETKLQQTVSLLPYMNSTTPSGTQWRICDDKNCLGTSSSSRANSPSSYHSFFVSTTPLCQNIGWTCSVATNNETYIASNCSKTQNNWCGECGCDSTRCDYPDIIGTYCDITDPELNTVVTSFNNCTNVSWQCPVNSKCSQLTPQVSPNGELVENFTDCSQWAWWGSCINVYPPQCWSNYACDNDTMPIWSNCPIPCRPYGISFWKNYNYPLIKNIYAPNPIPNITIYTAYCVDSLGNEVYAIDQYGNNTTSTDILNNATNNSLGNVITPAGQSSTPQECTEKLNSGQLDISCMACSFGVASGLGGCDGGKFMIGFLLVVLIIGSINGFDYIATKDHKFLPKELNILFVVMLLIGFTFAIPLLNPLIIISILIVSAVLLTSKIKDHLAGKGGAE